MLPAGGKVAVFGLLDVVTDNGSSIVIEATISPEVVDAPGVTISQPSQQAAKAAFGLAGAEVLHEMAKTTLAGALTDIIVDEDGWRVVATVTDSVSVTKVRSGTLRGIVLAGRVTRHDKTTETVDVVWNTATLADRPLVGDVIAKSAPASSLAGLHSISDDPLRAVQQLSAAELEQLVQRLPADQRTLLMIMAQRAAKQMRTQTNG